MGAASLSTGPLAGIKVMDLAWVVAGPVIGRALADFGATVIRVESSRRVETARLMGPFPEGKMNTQRSALYDNCNTNKLGLSLDLAQEPARAVARSLAQWADVVIESFMPGQMARFGLDYESLRRTNPSLIMVSTSLMGQTGPHANLAGYGNIGAALSGYQMIVGAADEMPVGPFGPYTDYVGPRFSLVTLLAALDHRRRTGEGCLIDVSQAEAGIAFLAPQIADYCVSGHVVRAQGNRDEAFAPHGVFRAAGKDSWVAIVARNDDEWRALAAIVGGEQLTGDTRFATLAARKDNENTLEEVVGAWTATRDATAIEVQLQGAGIPAYVVASTDEFVSDPQLKSQGHIRSLPHPLGGESVFEAARYQLSSTPPLYERSAPHFGRDNDQVLGQILGYDAERIASLKDCGALV